MRGVKENEGKKRLKVLSVDVWLQRGTQVVWVSSEKWRGGSGCEGGTLSRSIRLLVINMKRQGSQILLVYSLIT